MKQKLAGYGVAFVVATICAFLFLGLYAADFTVPFVYARDALANQMLVKSILDTGWFLTNSFIGAPFDQAMHDYPIGEFLNMLLIAAIGIVTSDSGLAINLFYLATYPLITVTSVWTLRKFGLGWVTSIAGGLLFAFAPYHLLRNQEHLFYSTYYLVPPMIFILVRLLQGNSLFFTGNSIRSFDLRGTLALPTLIISALMGLTSIYFSYFTIWLLLSGGLLAMLIHKRWLLFVSACIIGSVILATLLLNLSPVIAHKLSTEPNAAFTARDPVDTERYALKPIHLFIPPHTLFPPLTEWRQTYFSETDNNLESLMYSSYLGIAGIAGFGILMLLLLTNGVNWYQVTTHNVTNWPISLKKTLFPLAQITVLTLILILHGGLSSFVSFTFFSQIRAVNRMSIFIMFCAIAALMIVGDMVRRRLSKSGNQAVFYTFFPIIILLLVWEQTATITPQYTQIKQKYENDRVFVEDLETRMPKNGMVYQYPYKQFPESPSVGMVHMYQPILGYLHSEELRWSFGGIKGREGDIWHLYLAQIPEVERLRFVSLSGFEGIWFDRFGYRDRGAELLDRFGEVLGKGVISRDGRYVFYSMNSFNATQQDIFDEEVEEHLRKLVMKPIVFNWESGFHSEVRFYETTWRWLGENEGIVIITNTADQDRPVIISMRLSTALPGPYDVTMKGPGIEGTVEVTDREQIFREEVTLPPGSHRFVFATDAPEIEPREQPGARILKVTNFRVYDDLEREL